MQIIIMRGNRANEAGTQVMDDFAWMDCVLFIISIEKRCVIYHKNSFKQKLFFSRLEGYIHILHDEGEFGVIKKF